MDHGRPHRQHRKRVSGTATPNEPKDPQSAHQWTQRLQMKYTTPRVHESKPNAPERTQRPLVRKRINPISMDQSLKTVCLSHSAHLGVCLSGTHRSPGHVREKQTTPYDRNPVRGRGNLTIPDEPNAAQVALKRIQRSRMNPTNPRAPTRESNDPRSAQ